MPKIPSIYSAELEAERAEAFRKGVDFATDKAIALLNEKVMPAAAAGIKKVRDAAYAAGAQAGADAAMAAIARTTRQVVREKPR